MYKVVCYLLSPPSSSSSSFRLRSRFPHGDVSTNPGYILSPVIPQRDGGGDGGCSVKVSIEISDSQEPVTFTCDGK